MLMAQVEYFEGEIPLRGLLPPRAKTNAPLLKCPQKVGWVSNFMGCGSYSGALNETAGPGTWMPRHC